MSKPDLVSALEQASSLLRRVDAPFWAEKIDQTLKACDHEPSSRDARQILSWYGGMGSFNDLLISSANGHTVRQEDAAALNDRLTELRKAIYAGASQLARDT